MGKVECSFRSFFEVFGTFSLYIYYKQEHTLFFEVSGTFSLCVFLEILGTL